MTATYEERRPQPRSQAPLRVFVVEDLVPVRDMIVEGVDEIIGAQVAGLADTEAEAMSWLRENDCDVLILDLELREGNGLGVLKALAAEQLQPKLVKIVYSNHVTPSTRRLATQFGAAYFFDKTLHSSQLFKLLQELSVGPD